MAEAVKENEKYLADLNRTQLRAGLSADGNFINPSYSANYARYKADVSTYHAPFGTPDLFLTGVFQRGFKVIVNGQTYEITSTDTSKLNKLTGKYDKIFGLHDGSRKLAKIKNSRTIGKMLRNALRI